MQTFLNRLQMHLDDVLRFTRGVPDGQFTAAPAEGKWSLHELTCHLWRVQEVFEERIDTILAEDRPRIVYYQPEGDKEFEKLVALPPAQALAGFAGARLQLVEKLSGLGPSQWKRGAQHPQWLNFTVAFQVEYMVHHEAHHLYQMYQIRARIEGPPPMHGS